jgi:hypothetical protein
MESPFNDGRWSPFDIFQLPSRNILEMSPTAQRIILVCIVFNFWNNGCD